MFARNEQRKKGKRNIYEKNHSLEIKKHNNEEEKEEGTIVKIKKKS
jgi:hypothetical protein